MWANLFMMSKLTKHSEHVMIKDYMHVITGWQQIFEGPAQYKGASILIVVFFHKMELHHANCFMFCSR
jgi:hypothetical protein